MAKGILGQYGAGYENPILYSDSQDYTTANVNVAYEREQAYKNSLFGKVSSWVDQNKEQLEGASVFNPITMALDGVKSASNWLGGAAFPERIGHGDMLAPLGVAGMAAPFSPSNAVGMFGGRLARTADHKALAKAEQMSAEGASRDDIWNQTGWFQGADGKWRFEIDDSNARTSKFWETGLLSKVLKHRDLYDAYPDVGNIPVRKMQKNSGMHAAYTPPGDGWWGRFTDPERINLDTSLFRGFDITAVKPLLMHEAQHAIQHAEGFARGASIKEYSSPEHASSVRDAADALMLRDGVSAMDWDRKRPSYERRAQEGLNLNAYERSAGEIEARNVEDRMLLTPEERRALPPWQTAEIPEHKQLLQFFDQPTPRPLRTQRLDDLVPPPSTSTNRALTRR